METTNLHDLEIEILEIIKDVVDFYRNDKSAKKDSISTLTMKIKTNIANYGLSKRYEVKSSLNNTEWLYDLTFVNKAKDYIEPILAFESELSVRRESGLLVDFDKLLLSNSSYRIFFCFGEGNYKETNYQSRFDLFKKRFFLFKNLPKDSRCLVIVWEDYNSGNVFHQLLIK
jgi:hypothetical protein